jgi:Flp pilus assembly protein TadG
MTSRFSPRRRAGAATVELAFVAPLFVLLLLGAWEVGRMIQLQQILSTAAREGARLAAQGVIINESGSPTQVNVKAGEPCVKATVVNYLKQAGLNVSERQVGVAFEFVTGDTKKTEPYQAAKGQQFRVTVTIPLSALRWSPIGKFTPNAMSSSVVWSSLVDEPFTINTTIPEW